MLSNIPLSPSDIFLFVVGITIGFYSIISSTCISVSAQKGNSLNISAYSVTPRAHTSLALPENVF